MKSRSIFRLEQVVPSSQAVLPSSHPPRPALLQHGVQGFPTSAGAPPDRPKQASHPVGWTPTPMGSNPMRTGKPFIHHHHSPHGGFRKWWYPQIIHFNRVFHYKPSILGYPYFWKPPPSTTKSPNFLGPWCIMNSSPNFPQKPVSFRFRGWTSKISMGWMILRWFYCNQLDD